MAIPLKYLKFKEIAGANMPMKLHVLRKAHRFNTTCFSDTISSNTDKCVMNNAESIEYEIEALTSAKEDQFRLMDKGCTRSVEVYHITVTGTGRMDSTHFFWWFLIVIETSSQDITNILVEIYQFVMKGFINCFTTHQNKIQI